MTENKRFGYGADVNWQGDIIIDYETEKSYDFYEVGKLLNELSEENNDLKKEIKKLKCINKQVEGRLESSGIGITLDMGECE